MLRQQENKDSVTTHHVLLQTLASGERVVGTQVNARQPVLAIQVGSDINAGVERRLKPNEDTLLVTHGVIPSSSGAPKPFVLLIVADGMGGQGHGREASQLAVRSLADTLSGSLGGKPFSPENVLSLLREGIQSANLAVYQRNQQQKTRMGTTMTATLLVDTTAYVAHVGDSRFYLYREPIGLTQITQDHSLVAALVTAGVIQAEDIYTHPNRNLIYRSLGEKPTVEVDTHTVPLATGDVLLLCSDGLWEMVRDQQIAARLTSSLPDPARMAHALVQSALTGGGVDNISVIVAQVSKG